MSSRKSFVINVFWYSKSKQKQICQKSNLGIIRFVAIFIDPFFYEVYFLLKCLGRLINQIEWKVLLFVVCWCVCMKHANHKIVIIHFLVSGHTWLHRLDRISSKFSHHYVIRICFCCLVKQFFFGSGCGWRSLVWISSCPSNLLALINKQKGSSKWHTYFNFLALIQIMLVAIMTRCKKVSSTEVREARYFSLLYYDVKTFQLPTRKLS